MRLRKQIWQLKGAVAALEHYAQDADKQLQCFHDWRYMHMHKDMAVFFCKRCGGIQKREWQDLVGKEIEGLGLLGIHEPGKKTKAL